MEIEGDVKEVIRVQRVLLVLILESGVVHWAWTPRLPRARSARAILTRFFTCPVQETPVEPERENLIGKGPTLIPARKCGPSDIRGVLVQTFSDLYEIDMSGEAKEKKGAEAQEDGAPEVDDGSEAKGKPAAADGAGSLPMRRPRRKRSPPRTRRSRAAVEEEIKEIQASLKEARAKAETLEKFLEERHKKQLDVEHDFSRTIHKQWGLMPGVDIPAPARIVEASDGKHYLPVDDGKVDPPQARAGLTQEMAALVPPEDLIDLKEILYGTAAERFEVTRLRALSPPHRWARVSNCGK